MIHLRAFISEDESFMLDILTNPQVKQTYMLPDFERKQDASPLFNKLLDLSFDNAHYVRAICQDCNLIGFIHDVCVDQGKVELGYVIHPDHQGHGYMSKALSMAINELFDSNYNEIITGAFKENTASIRVMEKAGMHPLPQTDQIEYRGKVHSCVYYSKKKQE